MCIRDSAKTTPLGMTVVHTASYAALAPGSAFALASALALAIASTGPDTRAPTRVRFSNTPAHVPTHTSAANTPSGEFTHARVVVVVPRAFAFAIRARLAVARGAVAAVAADADARIGARLASTASPRANGACPSSARACAPSASQRAMGVDPMAAMSSVMLVVAVSIHAAEQRPSIMVRAWTRRRESTRARERKPDETTD